MYNCIALLSVAAFELYKNLCWCGIISEHDWYFRERTGYMCQKKVKKTSFNCVKLCVAAEGNWTSCSSLKTKKN